MSAFIAMAALCVAGWIALARGLPGRDARGATRVRRPWLRAIGAVALVVALVMAIADRGGIFGSVLWSAVLMLAAIGFVVVSALRRVPGRQRHDGGK